MDKMLVRPIELARNLHFFAVANGLVDHCHGLFVGHLIQRYARIVDRQIPNENHALLEFAVNALLRWVGADSLDIFVCDGVVYRTVECFNWHTIHWLAYQLEQDPLVIDKMFEIIQRKHYSKFENVFDAFTAFAVGTITLEALHVVFCKLKGVEILGRKYEYAAEFIRTFAECFAIVDEFLGEDWAYLTDDNVDQIESIVVEFHLIELENLKTFIKLV